MVFSWALALAVSLSACGGVNDSTDISTDVSTDVSANDNVNSRAVPLPPDSSAVTVPVVQPTTSKPATVLVLGDSISAAYGIQREKGWVQLLQNHLRSIDEEFTVVNASISGETTGGGLARFAQSLASHQPRIAIIGLGGNDGLRGYPLTQVRDNVTALIQMAKAANSKVLLLGMQIPPNYGARYSNGFAKLFNDIAAEQQVSLVPSFLEKVALTPGMLQADGIHPVQAAQPMLLDAVQPVLEPLLTTDG